MFFLQIFFDFVFQNVENWQPQLSELCAGKQQGNPFYFYFFGIFSLIRIQSFYSSSFSFLYILHDSNPKFTFCFAHSFWIFGSSFFFKFNFNNIKSHIIQTSQNLIKFISRILGLNIYIYFFFKKIKV